MIRVSTDRPTALLLSLLLAACAAPGAGPNAGPRPSGAGAAPADAPPPPDAATPVEEGLDFAVYRSDGTPATFGELLAEAASAEAVLLGEEHDDAIGHRVQYRVFTGVHARAGGDGPAIHPTADGSQAPAGRTGGRNVVLSLEMFERDVQYIVDEYLDDLITEDHFLRSARPWDNYPVDYRPLVEYAKVHEVPVVAANAPRRYVNLASREGRGAIDALPATAKAHLPPLPYPEPTEAYRAEWDALMGGAAMHMPGSPLDGQTLWDAAMAHAVASALEARDDALVVHLAGGFHVENFTGTPEALQHYRPGTRALVVAIRPADDPTAFRTDLAGAGDFVVLTRRPGG